MNRIMKRNYPPLGLRKNWRASCFDQEYFCPVCDQEIQLKPVYRLTGKRTVLSSLTTRFHHHFDDYHRKENSPDAPPNKGRGSWNDRAAKKAEGEPTK